MLCGKICSDQKPLEYLQFQRIGYFMMDKDSTAEHLVFNRTVGLKDTWSKKTNNMSTEDLSYFQEEEFKKESGSLRADVTRRSVGLSGSRRTD